MDFSQFFNFAIFLEVGQKKHHSIILLQNFVKNNLEIFAINSIILPQLFHEYENMAYIYMDESGDLGFNDKELNSKYFLVTFLIANNEKEISNVMKNLYKWMEGKKIRRKKSAFFHANQEGKASVKRSLDLASRRDIKIVSLILKKDNISYRDKKDIHILYNKAVGYLLEQCEKRNYLSFKDKHYFIASRKETKKQLNENFLLYLKSSHSNLLNIDILIDNPSNVKGLELVDPISFAIYQKYEYGDLELYSIIKNKIILELQNFN